MVQAPVVALRVDVDTRRGLLEGVPRLLALFRAMELRASFFVTMGPDRSGLAIRRAWRPSFLRKMWRTNPFRLYGLRTLLSGTLLRPQLVGAGAPGLLRQVAGEGHEVAPHGYDHAGWQDRMHRWPADRLRAELRAAHAAFTAVFAAPPQASAAPGWRTTPEALAVQDALGYRYASDVRGTRAFRPVAGAPLATVQVPTTMPTVDELLGTVRDVPGALLQHVGPALNVFTLHAEVEGGALLGAFREFLERGRRQGIVFARLDEVAAAQREVPVATVAAGHVPGRSGWVACQADPRAAVALHHGRASPMRNGHHR